MSIADLSHSFLKKSSYLIMNSGEKIKLQKLVDLIFLMLNWQVIVKKKVKLFWKTHLEVILGIAKAVAAVHKIGGINRDKRKYTNSI